MENIKQIITNALPKEFKCSVSKNGLTIKIWVDTNKVDGGWTGANRLVYKLTKKLKLEEVCAGTMMDTMVRDWEFIDTNVEKQMLSEAKNALNVIKTFFNKYRNQYYSSAKTYDIIEQMRDLIATDEK